MKTSGEQEELVLPAIRAFMGDWVYYIATMTMKDVSDRVKIAEEIHESNSLKELIQRQLTGRAPEIKRYLAHQEQRFFNSFVIGIYGGVPQWYELDLRTDALPTSDHPIPKRLEGTLGLLTLEGNETLFAIDGQHRVAGIRETIEADEIDIGHEEVSALFVGHDTSTEGRRRTRRLFTTLNRYAKPVSKQEAIALDEDDVVAVVTREIVDDHRLLVDRVSLNKSKSIPVSDNTSFTSIVALYDSLDVFLRDRSNKSWERFKRRRPPDEDVEIYLDQAYNLYDHLCGGFPALEEYANIEVETGIAEPYRNNRSGGHLLFRPVGLLLIVNVIRYLMVDTGLPLGDAVDRVSQVPTQLDQKPWQGLLWDDANKRMTTAPENQRAATRMILFALGGDLSRFRTMSNRAELRKELSGLYNQPEGDVEIPEYV